MPRRVELHPIIADATAPHPGSRHAFHALACLALIATFANSAFAAPVSRDSARRAATAWLARDAAPMGRAAGSPADVATCSSDSGEPLFYVVNLAPAGFVIVAADDEVEPVLAFSMESAFLAETGTPMFDLLQRDAQFRLAAIRQQGRIAAQAAPSGVSPIRAKWNALLAERPRDVDGDAHARGVAAVTDISVAPMVKSRWDQVSAVIPPASPGGGPTDLYIYNYYTPPYWPGDPDNYPAGCTAVAWAQIMRFHQWPKTIGAASYAIGIDWYGFWATMRGGDGVGGAYDWENMPLDPGVSTTPEQIKAIGGLMLDAGIGIGANYTWQGTFATADAVEMRNAFHYAEAKTIVPRPGLQQFMNALRTSLDAGLPANLDIFTEGTRPIGHSLVIDGYGDVAGTRFHHLNLGWSGHNDAWYNFPPIDVVMGDGSPEFFTIISALKYNIDPLITGEMITGRITDGHGAPVAGATVTLHTTPARVATTNDRGIYAFKGLASNTTYTLSAAADRYVIASTTSTVTTGASSAGIDTTPNRIVDFTAAAVEVAVASANGMSIGASLVLSASTTATAEPSHWLRNGSPLLDTAALTLELANLQPANAGLYSLAMTHTAETFESNLAIVGIDLTTKIAGEGREVLSNTYVERNGNTFDQILLEGAAASATADFSERQITRVSYIDLNDDIVQVEFSGPGTLTLTLDGATAPALPINYVQDIAYMKGHASIVITGATQDSNVSIFSVGKATAADQTLFKAGSAYDGIADVAFIAIASIDGKFGGVRAANAAFFATKGITGLYAPGVDLVGPLYVHNITAFDAATPVLQVGSAADVRITGGDLYQENGDAVQVSGLDLVAFSDGTDSHGNLLPAQPNRGTLRENGTDVTARLVAIPPAAASREP